MFHTHTLIKTSYIKQNHGRFMNKTLQKAVLTRSRLHNKFLKNKTQSNESAYKKQINYYVRLLRKEKSSFENLDAKNDTDNKKISEICKAFASKKSFEQL